MSLRRLATGALAVATAVGSLGIVAPATASPVADASVASPQAASGDITAPAPRGHARQGYLTIPEVDNVRYLVGSTVVGPGDAGPYSTVTVRAESTSAEHQLVGDQSWDFDLRRRVRAVEPGFDNMTYETVIPDVEGVQYLIDGSLASPGRIRLAPKPPVSGSWMPGYYEISARAKDPSWVLEGLPEDGFWYGAGFYLSEVTPTAPTFGDRSVNIPSQANVSYEVNGVAATAGSHPVTGWTAEVTAHTVGMYEFPYGTTTSWTKDWRTQLGAASAPTFSGLSVTIPDTPRAVWTLNGAPVQAGVHWAARGVDQMKVEVAAANEGERFPGTTTWSAAVKSQRIAASIDVDIETGVATPDANPYVAWHVGSDVHEGTPFTLALGRRHTLKAVSRDPRLVISDPEVTVDLRERVTAPTPDMNADDFTVSVPNVEGLLYTARGGGVTVELEPGENMLPGSMLGGEVEVTATLTPSHARRLDPSSVTRWTFRGARMPYVVMQPQVRVLPTGQAEVTFDDGSLPYEWRINGVRTDGRVIVLDDLAFTADVVATHKGVRFHGKISWDFDLRTEVDAAAPTFDRATAELTVDGQGEVVYLLDGVELSDGTHELAGPGIVTVKGTGRHKPRNPNARWTFDGTPTPFTAPAPEQHGENLTIPYAQEVIYYLDGERVAPGTSLEPRRSVVTVRPATRQWTLVGSTRWVFDLRRVVTPAAPVLDADTAQLAIPASEGVQYVVGGTVLAPGRHEVALPTRVVVRPASETKRLSDGAQREWIFEAPSNPPANSTPTTESPVPTPAPTPAPEPTPAPGGGNADGGTPGATPGGPGGSTTPGGSPGGDTAPGGSAGGDPAPGVTPGVTPGTPGAGGSTAPGGTAAPNAKPKAAAKKKAKIKKPRYTRRTGSLVLRGTKGLTITVKVMTGRKKVVRTVKLTKAGTKKLRLKRGQRAAVTIKAKKGYVRSGKKSYTFRR